MMIYYITRDVNHDIFDKVVMENNVLITKNIRNSIRLNVFSKNEMRNLHAIKFFAIDIQAVIISGIEELKEIMESFYLLNPDSKVIIVANDPEIETTLLFDLKKNCRGRFILLTETDREKLSEEIEEIFKNEEMKEDVVEDIIVRDEAGIHSKQPESPEIEEIHESDGKIDEVPLTYTDRLFENAERYPEKISANPPLKQLEEDKVVAFSTKSKEIKNPSISIPKLKNIFEMKESDTYHWNCEDVLIGVVGTDRRSGTSTVAMHLTDYLREKGAEVSYSEADGSGHLGQAAAFMEEYGLQYSEENLYQKGSVNYYSNGQMPSGGNFVIIDFGIQNNKNISILKSGNINKIIIVSDYKPYIRSSLENLQYSLPDCFSIFNFLSEKEELLLKNKSKEDKNTFLNFGYAPNLLEREQRNDWIFERIIKEFIVTGNRIMENHTV